MKHHKHHSDHNTLPEKQTQPAVEVPITPEEVSFTPTTDEVARKAYFAYVNEGSRPGRDVQHWLEAESQLLAERKLTRSHGYHNKT